MPLLGLKDAAEGVYANYSAAFAGQDPRPDWLHKIRREAFTRFIERGFPTNRQEGWRQTNLAPVSQGIFEQLPAPSPAAFVPRLRDLDLPGVDWSPEALRLVFVNGRFAPGLSSLNAVSVQGLRLGSLTPLFQDRDAAVAPHLVHEDEDNQPLVALNTAFLADGAFVEIPARCILDRPIAILHVVAGDAERNAVIYPRTLILAGRESQAAVVETCCGFDGEVYFTNAVTTVEVGENASFEYVRIGQDSGKAFHVSKLRARQRRDSRFAAHNVSLGGALVRNDIHAILDGEGAECLLNGLFALDDSQHVDNSTILDHAQPLGTSREYYKGVLDGKAQGVFNGRIIVRPGAQHTDAIQSSKNLLLSTSAATINAQPQLEIYADDVRCTHGATVGQLDAGALFYLRSRGLGEMESRKLLIYAFAADVLGRIKAPGLREQLEAVLWQKWAV